MYLEPQRSEDTMLTTEEKEWLERVERQPVTIGTVVMWERDKGKLLTLVRRLESQLGFAADSLSQTNSKLVAALNERDSLRAECERLREALERIESGLDNVKESVIARAALAQEGKGLPKPKVLADFLVCLSCGTRLETEKSGCKCG